MADLHYAMVDVGVMRVQDELAAERERVEGLLAERAFLQGRLQEVAAALADSAQAGQAHLHQALPLLSLARKPLSI